MKRQHWVQLRKARGWTQYDVAQMLGISRARYSQYELGLRNPPIDVAIRLADLFGVPIQELFPTERPGHARQAS